MLLVGAWASLRTQINSTPDLSLTFGGSVVGVCTQLPLFWNVFIFTDIMLRSTPICFAGGRTLVCCLALFEVTEPIAAVHTHFDHSAPSYPEFENHDTHP